MKTRDELQGICERINEIIYGEHLTPLEAYGVLETCKLGINSRNVEASLKAYGRV